MAPMVPADRQAIDDPGPFDAGWLASRRWFRSKTRPVRAVTLYDRAELPSIGILLVLEASFVDGGREHYLVPVLSTPDGEHEPADGDGVWRSLLALLADGPRRLTSTLGGFVLEPGPALAQLLPGGRDEALFLTERGMGVEQSNTSIRLGDRLMLKVYRLLEPGINPEVELLELLTEAGFDNAPLAAGSIRYAAADAEPSAAAVVQSLVPARGDAWAWMLERLGSPPQGPLEGIAAASEIGGITAALHGALQSVPDRPGFPSRPATDEELASWRAGAAAQLDAALDVLKGADRERLGALASAVRDVFDQIPDAPMAWVSRVHGDYHLGQLLTTDGGFVVTDFEGEPARPLAERRLPTSPLRDVAGMLRSLDYAARTVEAREPDFQADDWLADARSALLAAYGGDPESPLLRALELEKACYEVRYEASFRPDWMPLPLGAIERLAAAAAR